MLPVPDFAVSGPQAADFGAVRADEGPTLLIGIHLARRLRSQLPATGQSYEAVVRAIKNVQRCKLGVEKAAAMPRLRAEIIKHWF